MFTIFSSVTPIFYFRESLKLLYQRNPFSRDVDNKFLLAVHNSKSSIPSTFQVRFQSLKALKNQILVPLGMSVFDRYKYL